MQRSIQYLSRSAATAAILALALNGCGASSSVPVAPVNNPNAGTASIARVAESNATAMISVPTMYGRLAFTDAGERSSRAPVTVSMTLNYNHQAELDDFVAKVSDPKSATYRQFITPAQFDAYYAPTVQQEASVMSSLRSAGFTITKQYGNRTIIEASAPSATVERFFSTTMHNVQQGAYGERFTNVTSASVPASIASLVRTASLSNLVVVRTVVDQDDDQNDPDRKKKPTPTPTPSAAPTAVPTATAKPTSTPVTTPTPTAAPTTAGGCNGAAADSGALSNSDGTLATGLAKPFDFPVQHGCNGAGYTAAIIDDPVSTAYLAKYLSAAGVTQTGTVTNEAVDGGGSGDDAETDLDVQTISGLAPGANIIVYDIGSLSDQAIEAGYNQVLSDGKAAAVNSSFGGCESSDTSFESSTNSIAEQGASEGVEFSASAGDTGSDECGTDDNKKGVSAPAGDPYFTSVGGVNFTYTTAGVLETVTAGDASCGDASGTCYGGGGVSTVVAEPSFQQGIAGMITSGRNQPDISLPFDPVAVYTDGAFGSYLGTSWSSPASVALFIEADELHGKKLGWLNPTLYSLFSSTGYSDYFTPCTSGNNIAYTCSASQYNQAAGIGAPKGYALAGAL